MTAELWRDREFMKLWAGQAVSELGTVVTRTALPIAAVLLLGATPIQMALLLTSASAAVLLFGLAAGAWTDRLQRRPIMIGADAVRAVALASVPGAAFAGVLRMEHLYAVVFVEAALGAAFDAAYRSYLPSLVGRGRLVEGNSKLEMASAVAEIGGPGLGGGLVQVVTAPLALLIDACSFVVSAVSLALIRTPEPRVVASADRGSIASEIGEGLRFVWRERTVRAMTAGGVVNRFFGGFYVLYTIYALTELRLPPILLGAVVSVGGVGSLVGAALAPRLGMRLGTGRAILIPWTASVALGVLTPLAAGPPLIAALFLFVPQLLGDGLATSGIVNLVALRQAVTPDALLGRVAATREVLFEAVAPAGAFAGAAVAEAIGIRGAFAVAVAGMALGVAIWWASPMRAVRRLPAPAPAAFSGVLPAAGEVGP